MSKYDEKYSTFHLGLKIVNLDFSILFLHLFFYCE